MRFGHISAAAADGAAPRQVWRQPDDGHFSSENSNQRISLLSRIHLAYLVLETRGTCLRSGGG
jgi:hypothetical protein